MTYETTETATPDSLAARLMESGALTSDWLPSYRAVPRDRFVPDRIWPGTGGGNRQSGRLIRTANPDSWWRAVWSDIPITTQWDDGAYEGPGKGRVASCSSTMPTMVFRMLTALDVGAGDKVLVIGPGYGWDLGLLCHRLGDRNVTAVEVDPTITDEARARLHECGYHPSICNGDGTVGHGGRAPYDRVLASCSLGFIPSQWIGQARPGAIVVVPWGPGYGGEGVVRLQIDETGTAQGNFISSSAFMRLRQQRKKFPDVRERLGGQRWSAEAVTSTTRLSPDGVGDWIHMFAIGVQVPDLYCRVEYGEERSYRLWLGATGTTSWASVDHASGVDEYVVAQAGPRRLWDELGAAWRWWDQQGRPGFEQFGMTTTGAQNYTIWLDSPDTPVPNQMGSGSDVEGT
ncbi:methyltransferase domain-containing protein [Streptomyces sp. NPDC003006]